MSGQETDWQQPELLQTSITKLPSKFSDSYYTKEQQSFLDQQKQQQTSIFTYGNGNDQQHIADHLRNASFHDQICSENVDNVRHVKQKFLIDNKNGNHGDWDYNDNSLRTSSINSKVQHLNESIIESFRINPTDNWQWNFEGNNSASSSNQLEESKYENNNILTIVPVFASDEKLLSEGQQGTNHNLHLKGQNLTVQEKTSLSKIHQPEWNRYEGSQMAQPSVFEHTQTHKTYFATQKTVTDDASSNNITSPVYVSQAKPVPKPSRQYARPPAQYTSESIEMPENTLPLISSSPTIFINPPRNKTIESDVIFKNFSLPLPILETNNFSSIPATLPLPILEANSLTSIPEFFKHASTSTSHHNTRFATIPNNTQLMNIVLPPPPEDFANPIIENNGVVLPENSEVLQENQEVAPNNDRNKYLQTSHLSESAGFVSSDVIEMTEDQNNEADSFPPPGLSRLVLGQPELNNEPAGRIMPGIEIASNFIIERQADGEDTSVDQSQQQAPRQAFISGNPQMGTMQNDVDSANLDIAADRNLYLVPGESNSHDYQRVVTGLENDLNEGIHGQIVSEQREIELDGENIEDQQSQAIKGNNTFSRIVSVSQPENPSNEPRDLEAYVKDMSNISKGNDNSVHHRIRKNEKNRRGTTEEKKRHSNDVKDNRSERYESEDSDLSSERNHFDRSIQGNRDNGKTDARKKKRHENNELGVGSDRSKNRDKSYNLKLESGVNSDRRSRYEKTRCNNNKYETKDSIRQERRKDIRNDQGGDAGARIERDRDAYDDYRHYRKHNLRNTQEAKRNRDGNRRRNNRDYNNTLDSRSNREKPSYSEYDEYRNNSSRTARESDMEKEHARNRDFQFSHNIYSYPPNYGYDPYAYYYEEIARRNPQAYTDWYKKFLWQQNSIDKLSNDGRESVHSGRSSANIDKDRTENSTLNSTKNVATVVLEPQRFTPCKFTSEHAVGSLSTGLIVSVKPKYLINKTNNIVKIIKLGANDTTKQLFQSYPGPLIRGITHKKTIIEFCEEQIRLGPSITTKDPVQDSMNIVVTGNTNQASFTLMWNLLILLLRQNGTVVGTDIAELLMRNEIEYPYVTVNNITKAKKPNKQAEVEHISQLNEKLSKDSSFSDSNKEADSLDDRDDSEESVSIVKCLNEEEITAKFRNYLLYGNVIEALDWATDNNLWGHALFLASKVDRRSHANVMMKFANKLSLNDPLQTLYQLMSEHTPSSVTSVQDEKWGDWRPHLSMIVSNTPQKPELNRKTITSLGDSLFSRGDLYAAHFCYLMAQVGFSKYRYQSELYDAPKSNLTKLVLLGSSHYQSFSEFSQNEAIIMTEIYEYACSLNDENFFIAEFHPFKYLLATRMLDYGYQLKSLMYMEQLSQRISQYSSKYESSFIKKIYEFADRLKFFDPVMEKTMDSHNPNEISSYTWSNFEDQKWLQELRRTVFNHDGVIKRDQHIKSTDTKNEETQFDQQFTEINKQFCELNMQYNSSYSVTHHPEQAEKLIKKKSNETPLYPRTSDERVNNSQISKTKEPQYENVCNHTDIISSATGLPSWPSNPNDMPVQISTTGNVINYGDIYMETQAQAPQISQHVQQYIAVGGMDTGQQPMQNSYDYWGEKGQQSDKEFLRPTISMPNSQSINPGFSKSYVEEPSQQEDETRKNQHVKSDSKDVNKGVQPINQNSGWFGGIWNKLSLKPKNQMILPDDKNPAIIWDTEKKKWINTDGDETQEDTVKLPPKMCEKIPKLLAKQSEFETDILQPYPTKTNYAQLSIEQPLESVPSQDVAQYCNAISEPSSNSPSFREPIKLPSLQSNMFKMQRNRTLKNSYVDVFNQSGEPFSKVNESVLAPALPPVAVPADGFFIPNQKHNEDSYQNQFQQLKQQEGVPLFYNPYQF